VKKVKKLSETTSESSTSNFISYVLPNEMENDIKPSIEKLVKVCFDLFIKFSKFLSRLYLVNFI
jgi:hypothetical protein